MASVTVEFGGRAVKWEIEEEHGAYIAQALVQFLGPAKEDV